MKIHEILDEGIWKQVNGVTSLEIIVPKKVYIGTDVFGCRKYKNVNRPKKFYGKSNDEVFAIAKKYLKENNYGE